MLTPASNETACRTVLDYLRAMEARDLDAAQGFLAAGAVLVFPGGRRLTSVHEVAAGSARRYRHVAKTIDRCEAWPTADGISVLVTGTLYGEWADGERFDGIRFMDLFDLADGRITGQYVLNETAEIAIKRNSGDLGSGS